MKRIFVAALLAGTAISSAQAADLAARPYTKAPPFVAPIYDWTGFYFGVNAGVGVGRDRITHGIPGNSFDSVYSQPQGGFGGGQIGYNIQSNSSFLGLGPIVYGIEADIQGGDLRDNRSFTNGILNINTSYNQRLDWFGTVRGRIGLNNGPVLSYVTGGYAYGNVKTNVVQGAFNTQLEDNVRGGYVLGSGVEAALGGNWTGKIEYLYLNMGSKGFAFAAAGTPQLINSEIRENIFRVGLNYRIGGNGVYAPVVAANWSGFYLGGNVGSGIGRDRSSLTASVVGAAPVTDVFNLAPDGINGGVQAGYNWQAGAFVFGLEADIQASSQRDNRTCVLSCSNLIGAAYDARLPWFGTARGRIGYSVGSTLFYATGGYAYGNIKTDVTTNVGPLVTNTSLRSTKDGYAVGGGIETPFTFLGLFGPNWTSKTEYLYVDLGRATDTFVANGVTFTNSTKVQEHVFRTGINYHFNSPIVARY